jgi:hypothetical protein
VTAWLNYLYFVSLRYHNNLVSMANKKRPRRHSASENGSGVSKKRSVVDSFTVAEDNSQSVDESIDCAASGEIDAVNVLRQRVCDLEVSNRYQKQQISELCTRVEFLLSLLGVSETRSHEKLSPAQPTSNGEGAHSVLSSLGPVGIESSGAGRPVTVSSAVSRFRTTVAAAVHEETRNIRSRTRNIVITGLPEVDGVNDIEIVAELFSTYLELQPGVVSCKRLGQLLDGRIRKLLVTVDTAHNASQILAAAKRLRLSSNEKVRTSVFINADLTRAEAQAAYERRCRRRTNTATGRVNQHLDSTDGAERDVRPAMAVESSRWPSSTVAGPPQPPARSARSVPQPEAPPLDQTAVDIIIERLLDATRVRPSAVTEGGLGAGAWPRAEPAKQPAKQPSSLRPEASGVTTAFQTPQCGGARQGWGARRRGVARGAVG